MKNVQGMTIIIICTFFNTLDCRNYQNYTFSTRNKHKKPSYTTCKIGEYKLNSKCYDCPKHCHHCFNRNNSTTCVHCEDLFFLEDGKCHKKFNADLVTILQIIMCVLIAGMICLYFSRSYVQHMKEKLGDDFDFLGYDSGTYRIGYKGGVLNFKETDKNGDVEMSDFKRKRFPNQ